MSKVPWLRASRLLVIPALLLGCDAILGLDPGQPLCTSAAECDDGNPCTIDVCSEDSVQCEHPSESDGLSPEPIPTNCQTEICVKGQPLAVVNDLELPDDLEPCTVDLCMKGVALHTSLPDRMDCSTPAVLSGLCASGICTPKCMTHEDCLPSDPILGGSCVVPRCDTDTGLCYSTVLDHEVAPGATQTPGDCKEEQCINGAKIQVVDDADLPTTLDECDVELCNSGTPSNTPAPPDTGCLMANADPGVCSGAGQCVECVVRADCKQVDTPCVRWTCTDNACTPEFKPSGYIPLSEEQTIGDCEVRACNGAGFVGGMIDLDDYEDLNPCTVDACSPTVPSSVSHDVEPGLPVCGSGATCNVAGICAGCAVPADCPGGSCRTALCDFSSECSFQPGPLLTPQTAGDCRVITCDGGHEVSISADADAPPGACLGCSNGEVIARTGDPCTGPGNLPGLCAPDASCVQCLRDADCPDPDPCMLSGCDPDLNFCLETPAPAGTIAPIDFQLPGDCIVRVCDGAGQMIDEALAADVPAVDTSTPCVSYSCSADGAPVSEYLPPGQPCGGGTGVCDGMGSCG